MWASQLFYDNKHLRFLNLILFINNLFMCVLKHNVCTRITSILVQNFRKICVREVVTSFSLSLSLNTCISFLSRKLTFCLGGNDWRENNLVTFLIIFNGFVIITILLHLLKLKRSMLVDYFILGIFTFVYIRWCSNEMENIWNINVSLNCENN